MEHSGEAEENARTALGTERPPIHRLTAFLSFFSQAHVPALSLHVGNISSMLILKANV